MEKLVSINHCRQTLGPLQHNQARNLREHDPKHSVESLESIFNSFNARLFLLQNVFDAPSCTHLIKVFTKILSPFELDFIGLISAVHMTVPTCTYTVIYFFVGCCCCCAAATWTATPCHRRVCLKFLGKLFLGYVNWNVVLQVVWDGYTDRRTTDGRAGYLPTVCIACRSNIVGWRSWYDEWQQEKSASAHLFYSTFTAPRKKP